MDTGPTIRMTLREFTIMFHTYKGRCHSPLCGDPLPTYKGRVTLKEVPIPGVEEEMSWRVGET